MNDNADGAGVPNGSLFVVNTPASGMLGASLQQLTKPVAANVKTFPAPAATVICTASLAGP